MKYKALMEPKPFKTFRDKYLAVAMMVAALFITLITSAQTDSAKYSNINGFGFRYKRHVQDSICIIPLSSSPHTPYRPGGIRYNPGDSTLQVWTGHQWNSIITGGNSIDTAYALNDSTIAIETPNQNFFVVLKGQNISNTSLTANGDYIQDWANHWFFLNNLKSWEINQNLPDPNLINNTKVFRFYADSTYNSNALQLAWGLKDQSNSFTDSLHFELTSTADYTYLTHWVAKQQKVIELDFLPLLTHPTLQILTGDATKNGQYQFGADVVSLEPNDSTRIKAVSATTAPKMLGFRSISGDVGTIVYMDPPSSGASLSNTGSGYRLIKTAAGQLKTLFVGYGQLVDSSGNTDGITFSTDTSSANHLVTQSDLNDSSSALRTDLAGKQAAGNYITTLIGDVTASGPGSAAATIANNAITDAKLRQSAGLSLIGNSTNSTANVTDITASSDGGVLRRNGSTLGFGAVNLASTNAVTGVLPIGNIDSTKIKDITSRRTGVLPGAYAGGSVITDTAGRIKFADAVRNNLVPFNNPGDTGVFGGYGAHFSRMKQQGLVVSSNESLNLCKSSFSIGAWVKFDSIGADPQVIMAKDDNRTKRGSEYYLGYYPAYNTGPYNGLVFQVEEAGHMSENDLTTWLVLSQAPALSANQWYFIVGKYDAVTGEVKISVNGVVDSAAAPVGGANITNTPFSIGCVVDDFDSTGLPEGSSYMNGTIASAFAFQRLLTDAEITTLYNNTEAQLDPPGINPGTLQNGAAYSADVPSALSGYVNSVITDGADDKIAMTSGVSVNAGGSSISLWFKVNTFGGIVIGHSASSAAYVRVLNSTTIRAQTNVGGTFVDYTVPTMSTGTWYHMAYVRDGGNLSHMYLDDVESSTGGVSQTDATTFDQIGRYWDGTNAGLNWDGKISDVRIFHSALSSGDISNLYSGSSTTATPALWYKANEGSGTTVVDYGSAPVPHPIRFDGLPDSMRLESPETAVSWWDLDEHTGVRYDAKLRSTAGNRDHATGNSWVNLNKYDQKIFGSTRAGGNIYINSTLHGTKGKVIFDNIMSLDAANNRLGLGTNSPDYEITVKNNTGNGGALAFQNIDGTTLLNFGVDVSTNTNLTAYGSVNIASGNSNSISLIPSTGVTIGPARSTNYKLDVWENRTGLTDTTRVIYAHNENSTYNTTSRVIVATTGSFISNVTKSAGSNNLISRGIYAEATGGDFNYAAHLKGQLLVTEIDSINTPRNMLWQDTNGVVRKAAVPSGGITDINSQTGASQTISGGPGLTVNSSSNVHTVNLNTTLDAQVTDANNTGTSATDLYSKTIAANQLTLNGQSIHFEAAGVNNDATATVNLEALFAGNGIAGTGAVTISATGVWSMQGTIIRATSTTARVYTVVTIDNCTQKVFSTTANLTGLDFTTTNILKIRATAGGGGGGSDDITAQMWKVIFQP